jgi:hypothetical protein
MVLNMQNYSVLMFDGTTKSIANIRKSDVLMGLNSEQRTVKSVAVCENEAWKIRQCKGNPFILGCDNYICLQKVGQNNFNLDIHCEDLAKQSEHFKNNYKLYRVPVDFQTIAEPSIDPYFLGCLLADGCFRKVPIKMSTGDIEPCQYAVKAIAAMGLSSRFVACKGSNCFDVFVGSDRKRNNYLREELTKLGLWNKLGYQKFIPDIYKIGSQNVRLAMLAGLTDSDGSLSEQNSMHYYTTSELLANDVCFIAQSLGFACTISNPIKRNNNWKPCYTLCIFGDFSDLPMLVKRKIPRPRISIKNVLRTGFSIERLPNPVICYKFEFEESDQHFLKSDFMVLKGGSEYAM